MPRVSADEKDVPKMWWAIKKCPRCGYQSPLTNVCRRCNKPMDLTRKVYKDGKTRTYVPKSFLEERRLWQGWGVVFE